MNALISPSMTISQKRGRIFLAAALAIIAVLILKGFFESLTKGQTDLSRGIVGHGLLLLMLVLAFRGGQLSMKLTKGCAILFALIMAAFLLFISISVFRGVLLPQVPTIENTIPFLTMMIGIMFSVWALFLSADVRAFVAYQRELTHQKQLKKIRQK